MLKQSRKISALDLGILLANLHKAAQDSEVGGDLDALYSVEELCRMADQQWVTLDLDLLERILFSSNLLDEAGHFWHPRNWDFMRFAEKLLPKLRYDRRYGWIREGKDD